MAQGKSAPLKPLDWLLLALLFAPGCPNPHLEQLSDEVATLKDKLADSARGPLTGSAERALRSAFAGASG
jgi:hypothetical protein